MSVVLELPVLTISIPNSEKIHLKASLSTQDLKNCFQQNIKGKHFKIRQTMNELARVNQSIQSVIDDLYHQACEDESFPDLVIAGRHHNI